MAGNANFAHGNEEFDMTCDRRKFLAGSTAMAVAASTPAAAARVAAIDAAWQASKENIQTHGGMGYAKEFHVERYLREALITRIAPISPQLILSFIAEKALGLPKSY